MGVEFRAEVKDWLPNSGVPDHYYTSRKVTTNLVWASSLLVTL